MSAFHLPNELVLLIASNLDHTDVVNLQRTNHRLFELLSPVVWKSVMFGCSCSSFEEHGDHELSIERIGTAGFYPLDAPDFTRDRNEPRFDISYIKLGPRVLASQITPCIYDENKKEGDRLLVDEPCLGPQLGLIRHAVFLSTFFHDNIDGTGEPGFRIARLLRKLTGLRKIVIVIEKQNGWNTNYTKHFNHRYRPDVEVPLPMCLVKIHPELRYDLWMQPFLDVFRNSEKVSFEIYTPLGPADLHAPRHDEHSVIPETSFHAIHKLWGHVRIAGLSFSIVSNRIPSIPTKRDLRGRFPYWKTRQLITDGRRDKIPELLTCYSKSLRVLDIHAEGLDLNLDIILTGAYPLEVLKIGRSSVLWLRPNGQMSVRCSDHIDLSRLEHIEFTNCRIDESVTEALFRPVSYPKLRRLCFAANKYHSHTVVQDYTPTTALFPALQVFKFDDVQPDDLVQPGEQSMAWYDIPVRHIVAKAPKLQVLRLRQLSPVIVEAFHAVGPCTALRKLHIRYMACSGHDPQLLSLFGPAAKSTFPVLQKLKVFIDVPGPFKFSWSFLDAVLLQTNSDTLDRKVYIRRCVGTCHPSWPEREIAMYLDEHWEGADREIMLLWLRHERYLHVNWTAEYLQDLSRDLAAIRNELVKRGKDKTEGQPVQATLHEYLDVSNALNLGAHRSACT
ncbi:hypothetical protein EDC01DRAFT_633027 [Geopyxis carbonaria]|nr:hypothetical protein EDC01DRAFT_633027 [Geopyxis carbonaria]